jgi:SAM-dependent methyltransferase
VLLFLAGIAAVGLFFSIGAQALGAMLGAAAQFASSERVFGYGFPDLNVSLLVKLVANVHIGLYCGAVFIAVAWLFSQLGRILGGNFEGLPRLPAYSINILGSLAGLLVFVALSRLQTSPWVWFLVGLAPLLLWLGHRRALWTGTIFTVLAALFVAPTLHDTVWSSYQKLVGRAEPNGYRIDISDTIYQWAMDLRPETIARSGFNPSPNYDMEFKGHSRLDNVLVIGAGSGNDVAAALRAGAKHIDAIDIDQAIVEMGRQHHPEHPYDDPRVRVIVDDARSAIKKMSAARYDVVVFGLLDSHTQLGTSSVRLDNYVFTQESFSAAARLVRPDGSLVFSVVTAVDWIRTRFSTMLGHACGAPVQAWDFGVSTLYVCKPTVADPDPSATGAAIGAPVDDWPFPYLATRGIPSSYVIVIGMLAAVSVFWLRRQGIGKVDLTPLSAHMFLLGAAFLLMEVYAINRLALLFGTTWLVSAVSIAAMLVEILAANLIAGLTRIDLRPAAYLGLAVLLPAGWFIGPEIVLGRDWPLSLGYALFLLSPVFCAGIVFATSFNRSKHAGTALGANILGAVLGGWAEYSSMATGIRFMALVAFGLYAASLICLILNRRSRRYQTSSMPSSAA